MIALQLPCSARSDDIGDYLEMGLDRDDKLEGMSANFPADVVRTILEKMSDICEGSFGISLT